MNEYLQIFQAVTHSAKQAASNKDFSPELADAASELDQTIQPCIDELKQAAMQLQQSLEPSLNALEQAEAVWESKPQISNVATANIWRELGELSGRELRLRALVEKYQPKVIDQAGQIWQDKAQRLRKRWFDWDESKWRFKKDAINIFDKDRFALELRQQVTRQIDAQIAAVSTSLTLLQDELEPSFSGMLQCCSMTLDPKSQNKWKEKITPLEQKTEQLSRFGKRTVHVPGGYRQGAQGLKAYFDSPVSLLLQKSVFSISLDNFNEACQRIETRQNTLLESIFADHFRFSIQAISTLMSFYNDFLEKQERYRQESASQRELEKQWLNQQRQQIKQVQQDIKAIINKSPASPVTAGILGVCVGDALGLPVQFESRQVRKQRPVTEMIGYGVFNKPPGSWSDDASLTLCLVDALTQVSPTQPDKLLRQTAQNFCRWYSEGYWTPFGQAYDIGGTTAQAVERLLAGVSPQEAGGKQEKNNGNGSLMRILPLAFCYQSLKFAELIQLTHAVSMITHGHLRSQIACGIYISIAVRLLEGDDPQLAYEKGIEAVRDLYNKPPYKAELSHYDRVFSAILPQLQEDEIRSSGYVVDALEASLWCFLTTTSYKDAVLKAVNLGEDTDTTSAIAGGLAGIYYGIEGIPSHWLQQLAKVEDILALVNRFQAQITLDNSD